MSDEPTDSGEAGDGSELWTPGGGSKNSDSMFSCGLSPSTLHTSSSTSRRPSSLSWLSDLARPPDAAAAAAPGATAASPE
eukprot:CAMPEP_0195147734 /NCGR_PEP_ID=MMETSP0448-20130528/173950_1 /TAXON_ID=66468 /ORGANISM="Heterocapsa triquestra, Strain CCMP 448" /LENGTH=79 /DNA_ID=CAMNT_0040186325 /DNA_START=117 /DNA_END=354 /DNA_ORIENTATION=-